MTSFLFSDKIEKKNKKNLCKVLNTFENIIESGAFAPLEQSSVFYNIFHIFFKYIVFQGIYHGVKD